MTIKDLSAQTGYSVGTISRVLNNQPNVSDKAREVILKAAEESGFQLNQNAKDDHCHTVVVEQVVQLTQQPTERYGDQIR